MSTRIQVTHLLLWLFVLLTGIELGAGLYEARVITPLVTYSPPESVVQFFDFQKQHPELAIQAGRRFWKFTSQPLGPLAIAVLVISFRTQGPPRNWMLASSLLVILLFVATFLFFVPTLTQLADSRRFQLSAEEINVKTRWWVNLNWLRIFFYTLAWLAALRALTLFAQARPPMAKHG